LREKLRATTLSRIESIRIAVRQANGHPVVFTDTETGETTEYSSMREAAREMQVSARTILNYVNENKIFKGKYLITKKVIQRGR